jgi:hypothetical protein
MQGRFLKINANFSWHLIWVFALLEGLTVPLVPLFSENGPSVNPNPTAGTKTLAVQCLSFAKNMIIIGMNGMSVGFIGTLIVCLLLNCIAFRRVMIHLNSAIVMRVTHPLVIALWGGLLLAIIFVTQQCVGSLLSPSSVVNLIIFGFVSAAGGIILTSAIYSPAVKGWPHLGIKLITTEQQLLLAQISIVPFAILIGLYEGLAVPIFYIWELVPRHKVLIALLVGLSGGALSSLMVVALAHIRVVNERMWLIFSIMVK